MDSGFHGVPLSTAHMASKAAPFQNTTPSISGIRAPLTVDESDYEYSASSSITHINSTCSSYCTESDGFVSGAEDANDDDFEKLFVHHPDKEDNITPEPHFLKEHAFSKHFLKNPNGVTSSNSSKNGLDGEIVQENALFSPRPFVRNLDGDTNIGGEDYDFVSASDQEILEDDDFKPLVPVTNNENKPLEYIPIAKISVDSDDDSQGSELSENDSTFSGFARVPSIELLQRINSAPKIRLGDLEEEKDIEVEREFATDVVITNTVISCNEEEEEEEIISSFLSAGVSQDEVLNATQEALASSLLVNEKCSFMSEPKQNGDFKHLDKEVKGIDVTMFVEHSFERVEQMEPEVTELANSCDNQDIGNDIEDQNIDRGVDFLSSTAESESVYVHQGVVDIKKGPNESLIRTNHTDISKNEDIMTCAINDEAENRETEHLNSLPESNLIEAEIESEQASTSLSGVENLLLEAEIESGQALTSLSVVENLLLEAENESGQASTSLSGGTLLLEAEIESEQALTLSGVKNLLIEAEIESKHVLTSPSGVDNLLLEAEIEREIASTSLSGVENLQEIDGFEAIMPNNSVTLKTNGETEECLSEGEKKKLEKIQEIKVRYLSCLHRLCKGLTRESIAVKVLNLLSIAQGRYSSQEPTELEIPNNNHTTLDDISLSILVIGKTGVGKSATINSFLGENKISIDAFESSTTTINEIISTVDGVKFKIIDTPGLKTSLVDSVKVNRKNLLSIKKLMQKSPPDVVMYVDRLDMQMGNNFNDLPLLKLISTYLGSSIWHKSIVILTHATSILPPDGANGYPLSYELFVSQRSRALQHLISLSVKEDNSGSSIPISLVENHPFAKENENERDWKSKLLLLCYSVKNLTEVNYVMTSQNNEKKLFGLRTRRDLESQFCFGTDFKVNVGTDINKMLTGKICINDRSLDQVQIVVLALLPVVDAILKNIYQQGTVDGSK